MTNYMLTTPKNVKLRCAGCRAEILIDLQTASKSMHCSDCGSAIDKTTHPEFVAAIAARKEAERHREKLERQRRKEEAEAARQEPPPDAPTLPYARKENGRKTRQPVIVVIVGFWLFGLAAVFAARGETSLMLALAAVAIFLGFVSVIASAAGRSLSRVFDVGLSCPKCGTLSARQGGGPDHWAIIFALFPLSLLWALAPRPWHCPDCGHAFR